MAASLDENIQYTDPTTGELLSNGYIYIGTNGLDAKLNPITIYSDRALTTPISNPQRTGSDGRAVNKIWIPSKYSLKVEDSANVQKLNDLDLGDLEQIGNTILSNAQGINDLTATGSPTVTALIDKQTYILTIPANNTGAMTLTIDGTPTWPIKKEHDVAIASGDFEQNQIAVFAFNETDSTYELVSFPANAPYVGITGDTMTGPLKINSTNPILDLQETGVTADNGKWRFAADAEALRILTINDAESASAEVMVVNRTGIAVDSVDFPGTALTANSNPVWDDSGSNGPTAVSGYTKAGSGVYTIDSYTAPSLTYNSLTSVSAPAGATGVLVQIRTQAESNNAIAARYTEVSVYSNSGGTSVCGQAKTTAYEQVATGASNILGQSYTTLLAPVISGNFYLKFNDRDSGNLGLAQYSIMGYTV